METLPSFRYHPDPIRTGAVKRSDVVCVCCGKTRGFIYTASVYCRQELNEQLCPWCIASGEAAERFEAVFSDGVPLIEAKVPAEIVEEVTKRTPGFVSWQQENWLAHCGDACAFHGYAAKEDLELISSEVKARFLKESYLDESKWQNIKKHYEPAGDPAIYKFVCRHCQSVLLGMDFS